MPVEIVDYEGAVC